MRRNAFVLFLALLTGCAFVAPPVAPPKKSSREVGGVHHIVKRGENLWRIGRAYGVEVEQIAVLNGIGNPDRIEIGVGLAGAIVRERGARHQSRREKHHEADQSRSSHRWCLLAAARRARFSSTR